MGAPNSRVFERSTFEAIAQKKIASEGAPQLAATGSEAIDFRRRNYSKNCSAAQVRAYPMTIEIAAERGLDHDACEHADADTTHAPAVVLHDAELIGLTADDLENDPFWQTKLEIAIGANRQERNWRTTPLTRGALVASLTEFQRGDKDGLCITQGPLTGDQRIAKNVIANHILMLDCDTGESLDSLLRKVKALGTAAVVWTTHSHMKPQTTIAEDRLVKLARDNNAPMPDNQGGLVELARQYLASKKYVTNILDSISAVERVHDAGGVKFVVTHAPMTRARVLLFLEESYVFATAKATQALAIQDWKQLYSGVAELLGVDYDQSCVDPSRLMYTPRIAKDGAGRTPYEQGHEIIVLAGKALDLDAVPRVKSGKGADREQPAPTASATNTQQPKQWRIEGMGRFAKACIDNGGFNAADFLRDHGHNARDNGRGGVEAYCFNQDAHTETDPEEKLTLYAYNAGDATAPNGIIKCNHAGCAQSVTTWGHADLIADVVNLTLDDLYPYAADPESVVDAMEGDAGPVVLGGPIDERITETKAKLIAAHRTDPKLFRGTFGGYYRLNTMGERPSLEHVETQKRWRDVVESAVDFGRRGADGRSLIPSHAPKEILDRVSQATDMHELNEISEITDLPRFAPDWQLMTTNGYDKARKMYLYTSAAHWLPVMHAPDAKALADASAIVEDLLRDFGFSDCLNGGDDLPVRVTDDKAPRGYSRNPERGRSSAAAALAMLLTPFMLDAGTGPHPMFAVIKHVWGEGAGALLTALSIAMHGADVDPTTWPTDESEIRKTITTAVQTHQTLIAWDNVPVGHVVDSASVAAASASGRWKARALGTTDRMVEGRLKALQVFTGVNYSMRYELKRRTLPIKLDSGFRDPNRERPADWFSHPDWQGWLQKSRPRIVWALQTIVRAWAAAGSPSDPDAVFMPTFNGWAAPMQGILKFAGYPGLLDNWKADWLESDAGGDDIIQDVLVKLYAEHKLNAFSATDAFNTLADPMTRNMGGMEPQPPLAGRVYSEGTAVRALKTYLETALKGQRIDAGDGVHDVVCRPVYRKFEFRKVPQTVTR